jgi:hypothetical protein
VTSAAIAVRVVLISSSSSRGANAPRLSMCSAHATAACGGFTPPASGGASARGASAPDTHEARGHAHLALCVTAIRVVDPGGRRELTRHRRGTRLAGRARMKSCRRCSGTLHRSRRRWWERWLNVVCPRHRPYRCSACRARQWRRVEPWSTGLTPAPNATTDRSRTLERPALGAPSPSRDAR